MPAANASVRQAGHSHKPGSGTKDMQHLAREHDECIHVPISASLDALKQAISFETFTLLSFERKNGAFGVAVTGWAFQKTLSGRRCRTESLCSRSRRGNAMASVPKRIIFLTEVRH